MEKKNLAVNEPQDHIQSSAGVVINDTEDQMYEQIREFQQSIGSDQQFNQAFKSININGVNQEANKGHKVAPSSGLVSGTVPP